MGESGDSDDSGLPLREETPEADFCFGSPISGASYTRRGFESSAVGGKRDFIARIARETMVQQFSARKPTRLQGANVKEKASEQG